MWLGLNHCRGLRRLALAVGDHGLHWLLFSLFSSSSLPYVGCFFALGLSDEALPRAQGLTPVLVSILYMGPTLGDMALQQGLP